MTLALHYSQRPTETPLVLLPPFPLDDRFFYRIREILTDIPLILVDPPGFGDSPTPTALAYALGTSAKPSLGLYARALAASLDKIGVDRVVLAGVSIGGYTTLAFAEMYPQRVAGVGLLDTSAAADTSEKRESRERMASQLEAGGDPGPFMAQLLHDVVSPVTRAERHDLLNTLDHWYEQAPATSIAWSQRAMADRPARLEVLRQLTVPGLVIRGEDDGVSSAEAARDMADALGTEVVEIQRAGHMAAVEEPEPVAAALRDLWERSTRD